MLNIGIEIVTEDTKTEIGEAVRVTVRIVITVIGGFHRRKRVACSVKENGFTEREIVIIKTTVICLTESDAKYKRDTINIVVT